VSPLLDSDILVDVLRGYTPAVLWFRNLEELPSVPGLVVMELIQGVSNASELRGVLKLVEPLPVVWPTEEHCDRALADFKEYRLSHNLGLLDSLIAACAVGRSLPLGTFNAKHYAPISDLITEQPYEKQAR
jgi:predicted nucleic acid-binding protein